MQSASVKPFVSIGTLSQFNTLKVSSNAENTTYVIGDTSGTGDPDILWQQIVFIHDVHYIWTHGEYYCEEEDLSNLVTLEQLQQSIPTNHITKGSLATLNGESIEDGGDITLDLSLYKIVSELPTENILDNKIYLVINPVQSQAETEVTDSFEKYIYISDETNPHWEYLGHLVQTVDLSPYITQTAADARYMKLSNSGATVGVSDKNGLVNYSNNGQAFNAIRDCGANSKTGKPINAGAFGVKLDGTTAFSHKTYDSYNVTTSVATGARNTAVLTFSGDTGLRYAKNTGSAADVTDAMYKYVGVINSPDANQKVYSAAQVDSLIASIKTVLTELGATTDQINSITIS